MFHFKIKTRNIIQISLLVIVIFFSALYIYKLWYKIDNREKNKILQIAKTTEIMLPSNDIKKLNAEVFDIEKQEYWNVKNLLKNVIKINKNARFAYIFVQKEGSIYFLADSEPEDSKDYSPPGQEYTEAKPEDLQPFKDGQDKVTQPLTDRWGKWISVLIPMKNENGKVYAIFGMDFDAEQWYNVILFEVLESSALIILIIILFYFTLKIIVNNRMMKYEYNKRKKAEKRLKDIEQIYTTVINATQDMFYLKDSSYRYIFINHPLANFLKITKDDIFGATDEQLKIPYFNSNEDFTDTTVKENLESITYTTKIKNKNYEIHKFPVKLEFERIGIAAFIKEIKD